MKIENLIRELQKAQQEGIQHVLIKDNKIFQSTGIDANYNLIPGKKIFPLSQKEELGATITPTKKVPGDDMGEFARYMWDQDKGESGLFKYHNDKMREKDWDDPLGESKEIAKNMLKEQFKKFK